MRLRFLNNWINIITKSKKKVVLKKRMDEKEFTRRMSINPWELGYNSHSDITLTALTDNDID